MPAKNKLVGKYFHTVSPSGDICERGRVIGFQEAGSEKGADMWTAEFYAWVTVSVVTTLLATAQDMAHWRFYKSRKAWLEAAAN